MIFTATNPDAMKAKIVDKEGKNICKDELIIWYNTETKKACLVNYYINGKGMKIIIDDGLGGFDYDIIHLPGSKLLINNKEVI